MRKKVLIWIAGCFYYSGLVALARWWTRRSGPRVVVLNYHTAQGGNLLQHILYLRRHYRIMHVEAALAELYAQEGPLALTTNESNEAKKDHRTRLVLTFDDGYIDNYRYARELARDYCVPMTVYLIPGYLESGQRFWWFEGESMGHRARVRQAILDGRSFNLTNDEGRSAVAQLIDDRVRFAKSVAKREDFLAQASALLDLSPDADERDHDGERLPMRWEHVLEMDAEGWVSFGAHTMHHPILSYITDVAEMRREVSQCKEVLEQRLGHPVRSFAYPLGQAQHIDAVVIQAVKDAGYRWALTTTYGVNTPETDPYRLKRVEADIDQHWLVVAAGAAGLWGFVARLRWLPFIRKNFTNSQRSKAL
ncbi:polysaccharide deacetylase family protein [Ktedonobacteria bacterium brp13]|nr:polysaccharide deacetylase family protein [Ktedonobacteria bacterium brp13]